MCYREVALTSLILTGMDRLAAGELQELFDAEDLSERIVLTEPETKTGRAGALESVAAILADPNSAMLLILTAWIVSKRIIQLEIVKRNSETGEERVMKFKYQQEGPTSVLKELRAFYTGV